MEACGIASLSGSDCNLIIETNANAFCAVRFEGFVQPAAQAGIVSCVHAAGHATGLFAGIYKDEKCGHQPAPLIESR